jgi:signal transduction histidine kinase
LYDLFMCFLVYFTWRYAWGARELKVVYNELGRTNQLAEDLKQSRQESAEKTFFLNAICHDLRTPLNGMILHADLAKHGAEKRDDATVESALAEVKSSAQIASRLLDTLLDYAHVGSKLANKNTTFDLANLTRAAADQLRLRARENGLTLTTRIPDRLAVHLDRNKLERTLTNLIDNAIKFTDRGSIRVEAQTNGSGLEIHIIDTGCGIAAEHQPSLFREFFQIDNAQRDRRKGFGLGLAISRRLARQMGGDIVVESADGQGSRFSIVLPHAISSGNGDGRMAATPSAAAAALSK